MATIPVAPVLPDINSSANVAFSRWNGMIEEGQKQYADYFANLVRTGQIGSSMPLDESIAQGTVSYGGEKIKIGELFSTIEADDIAIPNDLLSKKIIVLCALSEFNFEYDNSSTTGTDGTIIPVEINYECIWNNTSYMCLVDFSDFDSTCNELSGYYESSTKTTKTFTRLAKRVIGQGASDRLTVYANGINVPEDQDPTTVSSQVSILVPLAIFVNTGTSFETYDVVDSVVPHDIDSSLTSTDSWGLPYIQDQLVTGSTGFSKAKNNFDVDMNGNVNADNNIVPNLLGNVVGYYLWGFAAACDSTEITSIISGYHPVIYLKSWYDNEGGLKTKSFGLVPFSVIKQSNIGSTFFTYTYSGGNYTWYSVTNDDFVVCINAKIMDKYKYIKNGNPNYLGGIMSLYDVNSSDVRYITSCFNYRFSYNGNFYYPLLNIQGYPRTIAVGQPLLFIIENQ